MLKKVIGRFWRISILGLVIVGFMSVTACVGHTTPALLNLPNTPAVGITRVTSSGTEVGETSLGSQLLTNDNSPARVTIDRPIRFERVGLDDGLSQSTVFCILQDSQGFMWFGTQDGLNKYDGYSFIVYRKDPEDPNSLSDSWISTMIEDHNGAIWLGTRQGGLNRLDRETGKISIFQNNPKDPESISHNVIFALQEDREGNLWIGTYYGLNKYDSQTGKFTRYLHDPNNPDSLGDNMVQSIYLDSKDRLWVGTTKGLDRLDPQSGKFIHYHLIDPKDPENTGVNVIQSIYQDRQGILWLSTSGGVSRFDPEKENFTLFQHNPNELHSLADDKVNSIYQDRAGDLWIGMDNGLDLFNQQDGTFQHYKKDLTDPYSLSDNTIFSIYEDRSGVVWFGTFGGGVNKFDWERIKFSHYKADPNNPNSLSDNSIFAIYEDRDGILWIGTYQGGLNRFDRLTGKFTHYLNDPNDSNTIINNEIYAIYQDRDGSLWIGTCGGLDKYEPKEGRFVHYTYSLNNPKSLSNNMILAIYQDREGKLWVGTQDGGLNQFDPSSGEFTRYQNVSDNPDTISQNAISAIIEDQAGQLWIGTFNAGLNRFDRQKNAFIHYYNDSSKPQSLSNNSVLSMYQDREGALWVATGGGGLNKYDPATDSFTHFSQKDGLPNDVIYGILEDKQGNLWLSTNKGVSKFSPTTKSFKNYDISDGLQSNEFNMGAYFQSPSGEMFFGGVNGFNAFYPDQIKNNTYKPPVVLTTLTQDGELVDESKSVEAFKEITLKWPNNYFEFEFAALSYADQNKNQYAYKLEGFDKNWNYIGTQRNGKYTNLPGKTYTLLLKGSNHDGIWNEEGTSIKINVVPPFWETWLFRGIVALVVVISVIGGYRIRVKSIETRSEQLERQVRERTQEIEYRNQEMQALYQADERMLRYINLDQVLQTLVDVAVDMMKADKSAVFVWNERREKLIMRVVRGFNPQSKTTLCFSKGEGIIGDVAIHGEPIIINDMDADPRLKNERPEVMQCLLEENIQSFMHLPIKIENRVFGIFNICSTRPRAFGEDEQRLFTALTQRAALSIENAQLFEQTKELAIIEERGRLARDLHDSAKQKAFAALAQLGAAGGIINNDPPLAKKHLVEAENLVYDVLQELVFLIQEMYPLALKEKGLLSMLREYIFEWENRNDITVDLKINGEHRLPLEVEQALYRIIQESLANVARHSQASKVDISLIYNTVTVEVNITDNGKGFDLTNKQTGLGLQSMNERVKMIQGTMKINSAPGKGTSVIITAPLNHNI